MRRLRSLGVGLGLALLSATAWLVIQEQRTLSASPFVADLAALQQDAAEPWPAMGRNAVQAEPEQYRILLGRVAIPVPTATPVPLPTPDGIQRTVQVPILMYHYIDPPGPQADAIRHDLSVPPEMFDTHLDRIQALGYQTITLKDMVRHLTVAAPLPANPIILTFDDGYVDHYTDAFPRLRERGMHGTFFVVAEFPHSGNKAYMTWDMIRDMQAWDMEIEAHGRDHKTLAGRNDAYLQEEVQITIRRFEQELGRRPRIISYPAGQYDDNTIRQFYEAGYWAGITTQAGVLHGSEDMFRVRRIRIHGYMNADQVEWLLSDEGLDQLRSYQ